jgi:cytidyltransferase-like protein
MQRPIVFVSGCFDLLHSGHVAFLQAAAELGNVVVAIGSDSTIAQLKGRPAVCTEVERMYLVQSLKCVQKAFISSGSGRLDFAAELNQLRPDIFVVNEDGDCPEKRTLCERLGIEYRVLQRTPWNGLPARTTTDLRPQLQIPHRLELSGGWLDQPMISSLCPGPVIVASIWPEFDVPARCGLATSAHQSATKIWGNRVPQEMNSVLGAEILFSVDNPPGTKDVSGSQDSLGIVLPGINRLSYAGRYVPEQVDSISEHETLSWLESTVQLIATRPRPAEFSPLSGMQINIAGAKAVAHAANRSWDAIQTKDVFQLGRSFSECLNAQLGMFPAMLDEHTRGVVESLPKSVVGWKFTGAGGGGFLIVVSHEPHVGGYGYRVRRPDF